MPGLIAILLLLTCFTAPADSPGKDGTGNAQSPPSPARAHPLPAPEPVASAPARTALDVPVVEQERERCGQSALTMVMRYYGASDSALREVDAAYDPVLRGSLITDLARAAERAGFQATVGTLTPEMLIDLLAGGVPPILLYQSGAGPVTYRHFGVVTGWDPERAVFTLHDGTARPVVTRRKELEKRWTTAGSQALVVRQRHP